MAEVQARGAHVIAIATEGSAGRVAERGEEVVEVPRTDSLLQPLFCHDAAAAVPPTSAPSARAA